ncbi:MAG: serine protease AprX [Actinomycetota bacterium]|jgi:serine protease AprX|nr:serine protease AprX [Actinomycetota bacterium]
MRSFRALAVPSLALALVILAGTVAASPGSSRAAKPTARHWADGKWGDSGADAAAKDATGKNDPAKDPGSLFTVTTAIGARALWSHTDANGRALTGQGVTVAVLDSGVAAVTGLNQPGKLVQGPDLSIETNSAALQGSDQFGHGTHLAGIIGAHDATRVNPLTGGPVDLAPGVELGVAPDARLLALKLATRDGSTDVSEVIAALDWITQHQHDNGMNVRVVNLAFGTASLQPYQLDPLAAAAENAWHHGIVVVVSGGNDGVTASQLTDPATDPYVIAVGAADPLGRTSYSNPTVATFSSMGTARRHVDLLAPGVSIASLRDPGSFIDVTYPTGRVAGDTTGRLFRGSGTSQAAAVVSGAAALLLQQDPNLTPDQLKAILVGTADPIASATALDAGAGQLNLGNAFRQVQALQAGRLSAATVASMRQTFPVATGLGSLEGARGGDDLVDAQTGMVFNGEFDIQGMPWNAAVWARASAAGTAWSGSSWNGTIWTGSTWASSTQWANARWTAARWSAARWSGALWDAARWSAARWSAARWTGASW